MKVAVIGATGLVGSIMIKVLAEKSFPVSELICAASERSIGRKVRFKDLEYPVVSIQTALESQPDVALFSAGSEISRHWAPKFAQAGTFVIDNSSCWRMDKNIKLVVPEINSHLIEEDDRIIANPNCSTIQLAMVLYPLHKAYNIQRVVVSTYQSISGSGSKAVKQMENERHGIEGEMAYPYPIDLNAIPHCDVFTANGYTREEEKIINESKKILDDQTINITSTAVRVPVVGGHSESVNISFRNDFRLDEIHHLLRTFPGIEIIDNPDELQYPMPLTSHQKDEVFVGRIRRDYSWPNSLNLWIVSDNLRKGAATNAVQIAEVLRDKGFIT